jgi:hypothetical protein
MKEGLWDSTTLPAGLPTSLDKIPGHVLRRVIALIVVSSLSITKYIKRGLIFLVLFFSQAITPLECLYFLC